VTQHQPAPKNLLEIFKGNHRDYRLTLAYQLVSEKLGKRPQLFLVKEVAELATQAIGDDLIVQEVRAYVNTNQDVAFVQPEMVCYESLVATGPTLVYNNEDLLQLQKLKLLD